MSTCSLKKRLSTCTFFPAQSDTGAEERAMFSTSATLSTTSEICQNTNVPTAEFHFMVQQGMLMQLLATKT